MSTDHHLAWVHPDREENGAQEGLLEPVTARIVVNELIFKLLCSYRRENQASREKEKEEEGIRQCGLYMLSRLIQANERKHPKQAIGAIGANDQRPTAAP